MVRVHRVGVVCRDHHAAGDGHAVFLVCFAKCGADALEHVRQERGGRALLRFAADLFVVKDAADRHAVAVSRGKEALHAAKGALQIVQLRRGKQLVLRAKDAPARAYI